MKEAARRKARQSPTPDSLIQVPPWRANGLVMHDRANLHADAGNVFGRQRAAQDNALVVMMDERSLLADELLDATKQRLRVTPGFSVTVDFIEPQEPALK